MAVTYKIPEEIKKFKPAGTVIKKFDDRYYVYEFTSYWDKTTKKVKTKTGKMLGKITKENGYIKNQNSEEKSDYEITTKEYGSYCMVNETCLEVLNDLTECFKIDVAKQIYVLAIINLINGYTALKYCKKIYDHSLLSEIYKDIHISKDALAEFLKGLGCRQNCVNKYYSLQIKKSSNEMAIDGHVVGSYSHENELSEFGAKYSKLDSKQFNLLTILDIKTGYPIKSKCCRGSELDKVAVSDFIDEDLEENKHLFIMDRGFYSEENISEISKKHFYLIPLSQNLKSYKYAVTGLEFKEEFVYRSKSVNKLIKWKLTEFNKKKILIFKDENLSSILKTKYLANIEEQVPEFTKEEYESTKNLFGIIILQTNIIDKNPKEIYETYKKRWDIETYYDGLKNDLDFNAIGLQDYYEIQGYSFILTLTGKMWRIISEKISTLKNDKRFFSFPDLIVEGNFIKMVKNNNKWKVDNPKLNKLELLQKLGFKSTVDF